MMVRASASGWVVQGGVDGSDFGNLASWVHPQQQPWHARPVKRVYASVLAVRGSVDVRTLSTSGVLAASTLLARLSLRRGDFNDQLGTPVPPQVQAGSPLKIRARPSSSFTPDRLASRVQLEAFTVSHIRASRRGVSSASSMS
jgi:hypothetical protein